MNLSYLYLLAPLHTGGTTQEGNLLGIARESHTDFPYIPSSTIRGRLRSSIDDPVKRVSCFGPDMDDLKNLDFINEYELRTDKRISKLEQGSIWVGDGSILWLPVSSLSHAVVWVSCPMLLNRWQQRRKTKVSSPSPYSTSLGNSGPIYLKDAIIRTNELTAWDNWEDFRPMHEDTKVINQVLVLPDKHFRTLVQMSLWRQVKVKLDEHKTVVGSAFRYEEAIPPDTLMYYQWGITTQANGSSVWIKQEFESFLSSLDIIQIGGQESLGRGFVSHWYV